MKLTKSQKICFGLLGAGVCALAVDQFSGTASATASLIDTVYTIASGESPASVASSSAATGDAGATLTARLAALTNKSDRLESMRDAFAPSSAWITERPAPQAAAVQAAVDEHASRFRQSHQLKAIVQSGGRSQAWVDASLIDLGQTLDGFTLTAVRPMAATFTRDGATVDLSLPDAKNGSFVSPASVR